MMGRLSGVPGLRPTRTPANVASAAPGSRRGAAWSNVTPPQIKPWTRIFNIEAGHFGIRTIIIEPGYFKTSINDSSVQYGVDEPPYDELAAIVQRMRDQLGRAEAPGPEVVAAAIADAVESEGGSPRVPVGDDAAMILSTRASMDDATFEATMRQVLNLDW